MAMKANIPRMYSCPGRVLLPLCHRNDRYNSLASSHRSVHKAFLHIHLYLHKNRREVKMSVEFVYIWITQGKKPLSVLFCSTFHLSIPQCSVASTYPMSHLYRRKELELASAQICFFTNRFQLPKDTQQISGKAVSNAMNSSLQGPFCYAYADWLLILQIRFKSGTASSLLLSSWILNRQVKAEVFVHYFLFFLSACFYLLHKQMQENKLRWPKLGCLQAEVNT